MRRVARRAVTLVEVMLASVVSMMLIIVLWRLFSGSMQQFANTQTNLEAMQVAQMVLEYVENDLHGLILQAPGDPSVLASTQPQQLEFFVSRSAGDTGPQGPIYRGERIRYAFVPPSGQPHGLLERNGKVMPGMTLKDLQFEVVEMDSLAGTKQYFMKTTVTATDSQGRKSFTLQGIVGLDILSQTRNNPNWRPNPYLYKTF